VEFSFNIKEKCKKNAMKCKECKSEAKKHLAVLNTSQLFVNRLPPWNKKLIGRTKLIFPDF